MTVCDFIIYHICGTLSLKSRLTPVPEGLGSRSVIGARVRGTIHNFRSGTEVIEFNKKNFFAISKAIYFFYGIESTGPE